MSCCHQLADTRHKRVARIPATSLRTGGCDAHSRRPAGPNATQLAHLFDLAFDVDPGAR
jgi:hypothetical protein